MIPAIPTIISSDSRKPGTGRPRCSPEEDGHQGDEPVGPVHGSVEDEEPRADRADGTHTR